MKIFYALDEIHLYGYFYTHQNIDCDSYLHYKCFYFQVGFLKNNGSRIRKTEKPKILGLFDQHDRQNIG